MDERPFAGETLTYGFAETELGLALVAASERGVAAVLLGEDRAALRREAARALAGAVLAECEAAMQPTLDAVAAMLATPGAPFPLALDLRGSRPIWRCGRPFGRCPRAKPPPMARLPGRCPCPPPHRTSAPPAPPTAWRSRCPAIAW